METERVEFSIEPQKCRVRAERMARLLSMMVAGFGIWVFVQLVLQLIPDAQKSLSGSELSRMLVFGLFNLLLSAWWLWAAWLGWNHRTASAIRWLSVAFFAVAAGVGIHLAVDSPSAAAGNSSKSLPHQPFIFLAAPLVAGLNLYLNRFLTSRLGLKDERSFQQQKWSVERSLGLSTFLFWTSGISVFSDLLPRYFGRQFKDLQPYGFVAKIVPVILAIIIYKVGVLILAPRQAAIPGSSSGQA